MLMSKGICPAGLYTTMYPRYDKKKKEKKIYYVLVNHISLSNELGWKNLNQDIFFCKLLQIWYRNLHFKKDFL